jgi:hypothetical protein
MKAEILEVNNVCTLLSGTKIDSGSQAKVLG